jgi:predicted bacteriocin transport accessory protein
MKKISIILLSLFLLVGCYKQVPFEDIQGIQELDFEKLDNLMETNTQFLLYIGRSDCGDCIEFYPILEEYMNNHSDEGIYYVNIKSIRDAAKKEDATDEEKQFYEDFYTTFKLEWTPTIEWISAGKIISKYQYLDEDYYEIEDRQEQIEKRKEFITQFESFMNDYKEKKDEMSKVS